MRSVRLIIVEQFMKAFSRPGRVLWGICLLTFLSAIGGKPACAQQATASVNGTVSDPSGAIVAGAKVTLRNLSTNVARTVKTNKDGEYVFPSMPIGAYELA